MRKGTCKYMNSRVHNKVCEKGIAYRNVTPNPDELGSFYRAPCQQLRPNDEHGKWVIAKYGGKGACEHYTEPTDDEVAESEAALQKRMDDFVKVTPIVAKVKQEHAGESWQGTDDCPVCGGVLHLTHAASNGHVWGQCETGDCLAWME